MAPMYGATVDTSPPFDAALQALRAQYPDIEDVFREFSEDLRLDYLTRRERPVDPQDSPDIYMMRMDYRPMGAAGAGRFLVTYHATARLPSMNLPYRRITFLTIEDRTDDP